MRGWGRGFGITAFSTESGGGHSTLVNVIFVCVCVAMGFGQPANEDDKSSAGASAVCSRTVAKCNI